MNKLEAPTLTEAECYARCYGEPRAASVRVIRTESLAAEPQRLDEHLDARTHEAA